MNKSLLFVLVFILIIVLIIAISSLTIYYTPNYSVPETKIDSYKYMSNKYISHTKLIKSINDLIDIKYPIVIKPDNGYMGIDVHVLKNKNEAFNFYNKNNKPGKYVIQQYHPGPYEVGLYYIRLPYKKHGYIFNLVLKKNPILVQRDKWEPLTCGTSKTCTRQMNWITPILTDTIDKISKNIPNFYIGRYDIRFSNIDDFKNAKNFIILELNPGNASPTMKNLQNYKYSKIDVIKYKLLRTYISILTRII